MSRPACDVLARPLGEIRAVHLLLRDSFRPARAVEPHAGRILERMPRRLHFHARRNRRGRLRAKPFAIVGRVHAQVETVRQIAVEVHLADRRRVEPRQAVGLGQRHFRVGQRRFQPRHAQRARIAAGQERLPRGRTHGRVAVSPLETNALGRQPIDVRRSHLRVAVSTRDIRRMIISADQDNIRSPILGRRNGCQSDQREQKGATKRHGRMGRSRD